MSEEGQKLEGIAAANYLGLVRVDVDFTTRGDLIIFGGENGAGKSSALGVVTACIYGARNMPDAPLRLGTDEGFVESRFTDLVVRREWKPGKRPTFTVRKKDGTRMEPPAQVLQRLFGGEDGAIPAFDPSRFLQMKPGEVDEVCALAAGINPAQFKKTREEIYSRRTVANAEVKRLEGALALLPLDEPVEPVDVTALTQELDRRHAENREKDRQREKGKDALRTLRTAEDVRRQTAGEIDRITEQIDDLMAKKEEQSRVLSTLDDQLSKLTEETNEQVMRAEALEDEETDSISTRIREAGWINDRVREQEKRGKLGDEYRAAVSFAEELSNQLAAHDRSRQEAIAKASFGVEGLTFKDGGLLYNGVPFAQASTGEKAEVAVYLAAALNPRAPAIIVDEGSVFDAHALLRIKGAAEKVGKLVLMARVGSGPEVSFTMNQGVVVEEEGEKA